jgi:hypothetical protein
MPRTVEQTHNSGSYDFSGIQFGPQSDQPIRKLEACKSSLEDALNQLGLNSEFVELERLICRAIKDCASEIIGVDECLNQDR